MATEREHIIQHLCNRIRDRKLVVLAGAGVSMGPPRNLPSWGDLIRLMAEDAKRFSKTRSDLILEMLAKHRYLEAADYYSAHNDVPQAERATFFRRIFDTLPGDITTLASLIGQLPIDVWLTTNYDNNLPNALAGRGVDILDNEDNHLTSAISFWQIRPMLVRLHGRATVYPNIVHDTATYDRITRSDSYSHLLRKAIMENCLLLVGYSCTDPPFIRMLEFIRDRLSGATRDWHVAILPQSNSVPSVVHDMGFKVLQYDDSKGHDAVTDLVKSLLSCTPASASRSPAPPVVDDSIAPLVTAFLSLSATGRDDAYKTAAAALALDELERSPGRTEQLTARVAARIGMANADALRLVDIGSKYLFARELIAQHAGGIWKVLDKAKSLRRSSGALPVARAISDRLHSIDASMPRTAIVKQKIQQIVTRVLTAQGKTVARSFANEDAPTGYVLSTSVDAAVASIDCPTPWRAPLAAACKSILADPTPDVSRGLFELAHAAFALESVFLNPADARLADSLRWRLYLDSNVVLRMLNPAADHHGSFGALQQRCSRLGVPMMMLGAFVAEIVSHARVAANQVTTWRISDGKAAATFLSVVPERERSPLVSWFAAGLRQGQWGSVPQFLKRTGMGTDDGVRSRITKLGIRIVGDDAVRQLDKSERETLWDSLRNWRSSDVDSPGTRQLRRAEATQVLWLADCRARGEQAWFLSIDGQLRRALKFVDGGRYSGFVLTPTAWMMRLAYLHWGEIDVAGFSEMMWSIPQQTPVEKIRKLAMLRVLEREPDLMGANPQWLRDEVEDRFQGLESVVAAAMTSEESADEPVGAADSVVDAFVVPKVEEILDKLAKRQAVVARSRKRK